MGYGYDQPWAEDEGEGRDELGGAKPFYPGFPGAGDPNERPYAEVGRIDLRLILSGWDEEPRVATRVGPPELGVKLELVASEAPPTRGERFAPTGVSELDAIRRAASDALPALATMTRQGSETREWALPRLALMLVALKTPAMSVGACGIDGAPLHFVGKPDGLYVCCGGAPQHCYVVNRTPPVRGP